MGDYNQQPAAFSSHTTGLATDHKNDRFVYIKRSASFLERVQNKSATMFEEARMGVGPYWESSNSPVMGSGLTVIEKKLLLPPILGVDASDRDFYARLDNFYAEMYTSVPFKEGRKLNIGLELSNSSPVSADNMPINVMDYIRYRHIVKHPHVAKDEATSKGLSKYQYFLFDPEVSATNTKNTSDLADEAMKLYLNIKDSAERDMLLAVMDVDIVKLSMNVLNPVAERQKALKKLALTDSAKMMAAYNKPHFEHYYIMNMLLFTGVLKRVGNAFMDSANNDILANNEKEMLVYLNNPTLTGKINAYRIKMQDRAGELATLSRKIEASMESGVPKPAAPQKPAAKKEQPAEA